MRRLHPAVVIFVLVFSTLATADPLIAGKPFARASASTIDLGRRIFEHNWARPESWTGPEKLGKGGDGLGPMFNEVSCAACHKLGGVGGAGPNEQNVELLSLDLTGTPLISARQRALDIANQIHPAFNRSNASIVLHQFGFGPDDDEQEYQAYRFDLKSRIRQENFASGDTPQISFELAQRNTPPLWGMGLIEALHTPQFRNERERIASEQKKNNRRGVSGRVPETNGGDEGWYGWRGQVSDLKDFVTSACAMELGLEVPTHLQPAYALGKSSRRRHSTALDLSNHQVMALTAFVANLPRPIHIIPENPNERRIVEEGESVFHGIGCAECHVKTHGIAEEIYSDFLLHDMGPRLADESRAVPHHDGPRVISDVTLTRVSGRSSHSSYSGSGEASTQTFRDVSHFLVPALTAPTNTDQEWRTPPLWGVADSAPYLHDGRAATLHDAIELHEGEASASAEEYRRLSDEQRSSLLSFLDTLRAPVTNNVE